LALHHFHKPSAKPCRINDLRSGDESIVRSKDARNVFGDVPLYAVIGVFHLSGAEIEATIPNTIRDFGDFQLKAGCPLSPHPMAGTECSGAGL
jgi:hypothetical protein